MQKIFLGTVGIVSLYSYVKFCIKYTHVCTMNVRYIMGAVYAGCLVIAAVSAGLQKRAAEKSEKGGRICRGIMIAVSLFYGVAVMVLKLGLETVVH